MATSAKTKPKKTTAKTPAKRTSAAKSTRQSSSARGRKPAAKTSRGSTSARKPNLRSASFTISPERRVDIIGIVLVVIGALTLLSLIIGKSGILSRWWTDILFKSTGWGAYAIPVILIIAGAWSLLRNLDSLPELTGERVIGMVLAFFNMLGWFQLFGGDFSGGT
ncbi:MAG TPA: hypothetical protein PLO92_06545, partial [Anaerolineaceae bacterium]|nr:hypothetical protein [Anaerolineaceae bacterium]